MSLRQRSTSSKQPSTTAATTPILTPPPPSQGALSQALENSAHLANLLPTGTLLAFQLLTPMFTNNGSCDSTTRAMTNTLLFILATSCFLASFTDSLKSSDGQVHYGFATLKGLWLFDYPNIEASQLPDLTKYRLNFIDLIHAILSSFVFATVALRDKNVVSCLYPTPGHEIQEVLDIVPIGVGLVSSLLFVIFPTTRRGIGFPVTRDR